MSEQPAQQMTNTVGYYNGNSWPLHLVISELNITLPLKPGAYVMDTLRRKINDSYFDKYTRPFQLSKEMSKNGPVPLVPIPRGQSQAQDASHQQSVRSVANYEEYQKGLNKPPTPAPAQPLANKASHMGMTVEEARKRGLIGGAVREVPEDYGITDTSGHPVDVNKAPPIKYAMESTPRVRQQEALPEGLASAEGLTPEQLTNRSALVSGLNRAATANVENPVGFLNETGVVRGQNQQVAILDDSNFRAEASNSAEDPLPQPTIVAPDPLAIARQNAKAAPSEAAPKDLMPFVCNIDGKDFRYRSQLETYAKRKYPAKLAEIMEPYPPTA